MMRIKFVLWSLLTLFSVNALAQVTIKNLDFSKDQTKGLVTINFAGNLNDYPDLKINKNSIFIMIPGAKVKKTINKKVRFSSLNDLDTSLQAAMIETDKARIKVIFPFDIDANKEKVSLTLRDNKIELSVPKLDINPRYANQEEVKPAPVAKKEEPKIVAKPTAKIAKDVLNEDYLNNLIAEQKKAKSQKTEETVSKKSKDEVKTTQAAPAKSFLTPAKSSFSLVEYGGKFVAFLGVVLLLFYGVITMMKKGFIKKGKLGFLNKTEQVTVLSQTYIAPKKSLMLVRAHNQVFLVSNTEAGIHAISEIKDAAGLLKDGEKIIAGNNFDDNLGTADEDETNDNRITLKEDIMSSNKQSSLSDFIGVQDKVKFSDQLKKKVKGLKPLQ